MSLDRCAGCGSPVDTDDEPEAYSLMDENGIEVPGDICRCCYCRDALIGEHAPDDRAAIDP